MSQESSFGRRADGVRPLAPPPRGMAPQPLAFMPTPIEPELKAVWAAKSASRPAPVLTLAIIAGLVLIFAGEHWFNVGPVPGMAPGPNSLVALGAASGKLVFGAGQIWRLVTAALLHANLAHIVGNCVVLFFAGALLERLVGRAWLGATFVVSGLAGSLASVLCNPHGVTTVGASGAIIGLLGAAVVCSFHPHAQPWRRQIWFGCARLVIPALIPFASVQGVEIDYNAHGGGFMAGMAIGFVMKALWPETEVHPPHRRFAAGVAWTGLGLAILAFLMVAINYPTYAAAGERYAAALPKLTPTLLRDPGFNDQSAKLAQLYPHDPRTHYIRGVYLLNGQDMDGAETQFRAALDERDALASDMPAEMAGELHVLLAATLMAEGRPGAAEDEMDPWCKPHLHNMSVEIMRERLIGQGLCGGWAAMVVPDNR